LKVSHKDVQKMRSTIRQFVRDWSTQGQKERDECYKPIIEEFKKYFPEPIVNNKRIRALFPGCGLARLVLEFAAMGYGAQGNEFSYFMLLAANFILNVVDRPEKYEIHPFIHSWCNLFSDSDAFETYRVPDVCPSDVIKPGADFSMVAGEFVEVYKHQKGEWDSVVTCFFIDTANNIIQYIETIYEILCEGGVWINFGPLLYHYADMETEKSIELSWEEVKHVILQVGFEIKSETVKECTYAMERKTMMEVRYNCVFFTAVKPKK